MLYAEHIFIYCYYLFLLFIFVVYFLTISGALRKNNDKHVCSICCIKLEAECTTICPAYSLLMGTYSNVYSNK